MCHGSSKQLVLLDYNASFSISREWSKLFHKQTSDADPEDAVIVPEIHCPHQTRILFCSDTSPLNDWDLDLQTPDIMQIF